MSEKNQKHDSGANVIKAERQINLGEAVLVFIMSIVVIGYPAPVSYTHLDVYKRQAHHYWGGISYRYAGSGDFLIHHLPFSDWVILYSGYIGEKG